ncbi:MAG: hypothetical protein JXA57_03610 [Armatimonadetes bacterium]|nr:hypothetical protein [Armatimonadota bacterium]
MSAEKVSNMHENSAVLVLLVLLFVIPTAECAASPDAVVAQIATEATDIEAGQEVSIRVTLANQGSSSLPPVLVVLLIDDEPHADWKPPATLDPGERVEWPFTWKAERGAHILMAQVDPLNDVVEADERNNSAFLSLGVADEPEPSPWPALIVGLMSLLLGVLLGFFIRRRRLRGPPPARFERPRETVVK